ncbi:N-formylglutamate amidohydrolase [Pseudohalocynthiibacter aestuariivivens]|jgi:predicted N-formylglutamate amidohydrolase|uniref:N-formylglutamate amidohydrolase n=1 Tax=Pseudohalocynthiibacter aestuariivivens TaxID=1591409 RepID=A0ABV5JI57_9RHOB|nr:MULTISPECIES: N-formylglutamate amidohydrolase [Pseudohalocynthiibacter]MBS9717451.1 N-formylglutamate amidohydrolase [Pseudohalocynthiibacter aestuariivivens]MCK0102215.1 N-formylglutamate amidohydrolase [Pseudohalocynthiibacter sp. F2068]
MTYHQPANYHPFHIIGADRPARWVVTCDHATNTVPAEVGGGDLGLPSEDMARHIAYDVGAAGVTWALAELLNAPAILSNFSRLVIDPNRGEDDPTLLMKLYDGTIVPANRHADGEEIERRLNAYYRPYHDALTKLIASRETPVILSIHSFTPQLSGRSPRPWHVGLLYADDTRLALPLLDRLSKETDLCIGANEPYGGHLPGDAIDRHAIDNGHPNVLIEIRNDLIRTDEQQVAWAERLAPILQEVLAETGL